MKVSQLITKTRKDAPGDETAKNAQLLIKAGYVQKEMAGVYSFLPLGLRVLDNICQIIREEMNAIGGQELRMTTLQDPEIWEATDRWDDNKVDVWFKTKLKNDTEIGLGPTHEEPVTRIMKNRINSYKDLPLLAYQIQTKFRNEIRAKSGVMRGREFLMKDLYSFSRNKEEHEQIYETIKEAYVRVFNRLGIGEQTFLTFASGGMFSQYSHEFQTLTEAGEDTIYLDRKKKIAVNEEVYNNQVLGDLGLNRDELEEVKAAEVGNIFTLAEKFSGPLNLEYSDDNGQVQTVFMGSYGIGPSRLVGVITELLADERGLVWPKNISPFDVYIVQLGSDDAISHAAAEVVASLEAQGLEVLHDDRDATAGEKFNDADLLGIPYRVVISKKTIEADCYEVKRRTDADSQMIEKEKLIKYLAQ